MPSPSEAVGLKGRGVQSPPTVQGVFSSSEGATSRKSKEALRKQGLLNDDGDLATPYRRPKLVMDYWCVLWFWPITQSADLPSRKQWWLEIGAILEGNIVEVSTQTQFDFTVGGDCTPRPQSPSPLAGEGRSEGFHGQSTSPSPLLGEGRGEGKPFHLTSPQIQPDLFGFQGRVVQLPDGMGVF
ncbi:hypothetical protein WDW89_05460 [Deltaproteobacteria bacterium TL4]